MPKGIPLSRRKLMSLAWCGVVDDYFNLAPFGCVILWSMECVGYCGRHVIGLPTLVLL